MSVYAIVSKAGVILEAPVNLRSHYNGKGGFHLLSDEERKAYGWYPCVVLNESYDAKTQARNPPIKTFDGQTVTVAYQLVSKPPGQISREQSEQLQKDVVEAVQAMLDKPAQERRYDGILSLVSYVTSKNPKRAAEAEAGAAARDAAWSKCYEIMDAVLAGTRPMPTFEEVMAEIPAFTWPA